jgi:hypothetical protein
MGEKKGTGEGKSVGKIGREDRMRKWMERKKRRRLGRRGREYKQKKRRV